MKKPSKKKRKNLLLVRDGLVNTVLSLFTCYLLSLLFLNTSFFNPLSKALKDFSFLDVYYAERLAPKTSVNTDIILVNIEHQSREHLALVLQKIQQSQPKVIGFDVILKSFEKTKTDTLLAQLLKSKNVVQTYIFQPDSSNTNSHPFFKSKAIRGFANFNFNPDYGVIREFTGFYESEGEMLPAFSAAMARQYLSEDQWNSKELDAKLENSRVINYQGDLDHFMNFTASQIIELEELSLLKDKAVILGYLGSPTGNSFDIEDKHFTPLNSITAGKSVPDMYGAVIHANILSMLISDRFMYKISNFWMIVLMFICSFIASVYFIWLNKRLKISYRTVRKAVILVFSILLMWIALLLFKSGIVLKIAPIILVTVFSAGFVKYYKHLIRYIKTKRKFKSYLK